MFRMILPLIIIILLGISMYPAVLHYDKSHPQSVGWCDQFDSGTDHYWQQHSGKQLFCAQMYPVDAVGPNFDKPHEGSQWWVVYIIGSRKDAIFSTRQDAVDWANSQRLIVDPRQVR